LEVDEKMLKKYLEGKTIEHVSCCQDYSITLTLEDDVVLKVKTDYGELETILGRVQITEIKE
jgi:hypothetical protein